MSKYKDPETKKFISEKEAKRRGIPPVNLNVTFIESIEKDIAKQAKEAGMTPKEFAVELFNREYAVIEFDEATGKASLQIFPATTQVKIDDIPIDKLLAEYKDLREHFPPVSAGIEYHKTFLVGSGLDIISNDPSDPHKIEMRDECRRLARKIYMDYYRRGLDKLLYILADDVLTYGGIGAEIVYGRDIDFDEFAEKVQVGDKFIYETRLPTAQEWKSLKGITRLKILNNAITRLTPVIDSKSFEIAYWVLDNKAHKSQEQQIQEKVGIKKKEDAGIKFHPFEILWLSWNTRGTNLKGHSIIEPVLEVARLVRKIQRAVGKGVDRWAEKKFFFVCGTDKKPWNKNALRKFLKYLEMMIKHHWTGIPVPQGFKVEEIGGEVFEATNILAHLIDMICAGMNYPRDFLERGRSRAGDKAWLAWQVKYGTNQRQLRRDIEFQILETNLWCKFGKTYREKKQNVSPAKRKKKDIYVPKIIWKAEGRWQKKEEIETLLKGLNVANPLGPEMKLAIERRLAVLLQFGDIELPDFKDLRREVRLRAKLNRLILEAQIAKGGEIKAEKPEKKELTAEEKLEKRTKGGVSTQKSLTGEPKTKGVAKKMGGTRKPETQKKGMPEKKAKKFGEATTPEEIVEESTIAEGVRKAVEKLPTIPIEITLKNKPSEPTK